MSFLLCLAVLGAAFLLARRWPRWRLQRALALSMPPEQIAILRRAVPAFERMPAALQAQLQRLVQQFLFQKSFVGCQGLAIDDEIRVTIAAQACLLLLNRPSRVYPALHTILVYPSAFLAPRAQVDAGGVITQVEQTLLGESWGDGRVVLSWDHVQRGGASGHNVVLHEFAHQLDSESGSNNGAPFLGDPARYRTWSSVLARDFANLRSSAYYRQASVLDHYGATSPAEFFAVATEAFFENPRQLAEHHPDLFAEFARYYSVDPRAWLAPEPEPPADYGHVQPGWH